jgi:hypothetical protein
MKPLQIDQWEDLNWICGALKFKQGNLVVLVVLNGVSKFISFPTRSISSQVVCEGLERNYFGAYGNPASIVPEKAKVLRSRQF